MKEVTLQVPDGKKVEWREVNGVTVPVLVDEQQQDNRPVTERIKTFEDAYYALDSEHPLRKEWDALAEAIRQSCFVGKDIVAFLQLRIIAAALNEGWKPEFTEDEYRYYPYFVLYTQKEIDDMDEEDKKELWLFGGNSFTGSSCGLAYSFSDVAWSYSYANFSARLAVKSSELAKYFGKQFIAIWADYACPPAFECAAAKNE